MFKISGLEIKTDNFSNFVGIRKDSDTLCFILPKGFDNFPKNNFNALKKLFFNTYAIYRKFQNENKITSDGFSDTENGFSITIQDLDEKITYSKLNVFDSILDAYNELLILALKNKLSRSENIDYSQIHKYLHKAIYLEQDIIYIDEVEVPKKVVDNDSPTLVQMFCFIYEEIQNELNQSIDSIRVKNLSREFREVYLGHNEALFDERIFDETSAILKELLNDIERFTPYKDVDFWHFYDAIYTFLYGENDFNTDENGNVWGLNNFSFIWEQLCLAYAYDNEDYKHRIKCIDLLGYKKTVDSFNDVFYFEMKGYRRHLRPDLVLENSIIYNIETFFDTEDKEIIIEEKPYINFKISKKSIDRSFYPIQNAVWSKYKDYVDNFCKSKKFLDEKNYEKWGFIPNWKKDDFIKDINNILNDSKSVENRYKIIDFKYTNLYSLQNPLSDDKRQTIRKQLVYELTIQLNYNKKTESEFWIPFFEGFDSEDDEIEEDNISNELKDNGIKVIKINYWKAQQSYLENGIPI